MTNAISYFEVKKNRQKKGLCIDWTQAFWFPTTQKLVYVLKMPGWYPENSGHYLPDCPIVYCFLSFIINC